MKIQIYNFEFFICNFQDHAEEKFKKYSFLLPKILKNITFASFLSGAYL